jgi:glycosyltransferase involved in cell wall biosynthesis
LPRRILYVQYTNPTGYPPLEHSSLILAETGWQVLFLGTGSYGADTLQFPPHANIQEERMPFCLPGWRQKLHYLRFCWWALWRIVRWRPEIVYASDPFATPVAWMAARLPGVRVIYHEHDSPRESVLWGALRVLRRSLFRSAFCIWPNGRRPEICAPECKHRAIVWNCPARREAGPSRDPATPGKLEVFFHGSIGPARLPSTLIAALALLPENVRLTVAGYLPVGSRGHMDALRADAQRLGVEHRFTYLGEIPLRSDLLAHCRRADVGLAFMPIEDRGDINESNMTGASNKPFDYLANGLALLVADRPDWRGMFADAGFGRVCDPRDPVSIAAALRWFLDHPNEMRAMGERGRRRIMDDWNYEAQFRPVQKWIESRSRPEAA